MSYDGVQQLCRVERFKSNSQGLIYAGTHFRPKMPVGCRQISGFFDEHINENTTTIN